MIIALGDVTWNVSPFGVSSEEACQHDHHWHITADKCSGPKINAPVPALLPMGLTWFRCDCKTHGPKRRCKRPYSDRELVVLVLQAKLMGHTFSEP